MLNYIIKSVVLDMVPVYMWIWYSVLNMVPFCDAAKPNVVCFISTVVICIRYVRFVGTARVEKVS